MQRPTISGSAMVRCSVGTLAMLGILAADVASIACGGAVEPGESKPSEPKPSEPKPGELKPNEPKPNEPKPGCSLMGCSDGAMLVVRLHEPLDVVLTSTFTVCRNNECKAVDFQDIVTGEPITTMNSVNEEGDGWSRIEIWTFAGLLPGSASADDHYRVAVTKADGTALLDVERTVAYGDFYPNGPKCGGACRTATSTFYAGAESGLSCTGNPTEGSVALRAKLDSDVWRKGSLTVCRNDTCNTSRFDGVLEGPLDTSQMATGDATVDVTVTIRGAPPALKDGDRYRFTLVDKTTKQVIKAFDGPVTYETSFPNGEACDVFPSRKAEIRLE